MSKNTNLSFLTDYITADITNGRIGINNASPAYAFDVTGIARTSTSTYLATASGNVGIGTTSPDALLTVAGANQATGAAFNTYGNVLIYSTDSQAINKGGSISFGGKYTTSGTPIATFARIHGKKENTIVDGTAGYLSFETTADATAYLSEKMRITSVGNVGIGTSSPGYKLHVLGGSEVGSRFIVSGTYAPLQFSGDNSSTIGGLNAYDNKVIFGRGTSTGTITDLVISSTTGFVGIATTTIKAQFQVSQTETGTPTIPALGTINNYVGIYFTNVGGLYGLIGGALNSGSYYLQVQRTDASAIAYNLMLQPNGGNILMGTTTDNGERLYISGNVRATGTITANSDLTLKKNLLKIENALEKVEQINGYTYEFKEDDSKRHAGVIAQEIQTVLPEIVNKGNDGILGVEYGNISALLIEAVKELKAEIEILKNK